MRKIGKIASFRRNISRLLVRPFFLIDLTGERVFAARDLRNIVGLNHAEQELVDGVAIGAASRHHNLLRGQRLLSFRQYSQNSRPLVRSVDVGGRAQERPSAGVLVELNCQFGRLDIPATYIKDGALARRSMTTMVSAAPTKPKEPDTVSMTSSAAIFLVW